MGEIGGLTSSGLAGVGGGQRRVHVNLTAAGKVVHSSGPSIQEVRVVFRRNLISVGCTDVTPEVLRYLLDEHSKRFGPEEVVLQP